MSVGSNPSSPLVKPANAGAGAGGTAANNKRFRAAHASFRLRMLHEQNAPVRNVEPDRDQRFTSKRLLHARTLKSVPTSPIEKDPSPIDLRRVLSGSQRSQLRLSARSSGNYSSPSFHLHSSSFGPQTAPPAFPSSAFPSTLGVDIAVEALRRRQQISAQRVYRTVSTGCQPFPAAIPLSADHPLSPRQRFLSSGSVEKPSEIDSSKGRPQRALTIAMGHWDTLRAQLKSPKHSTASSLGPPNAQQHHSLVPKGSIASTYSCPPATTIVAPGAQQPSTNPSTQGGIGQGQPQPQSTQQSQHPFPAPKSKFKMAHESFRVRMLQEMQDHEAVFMTKKRTADSKFSEFKGGDFNKYTAQSYTIRNGVEIFGANIHNEFGICGWILTILSYILIFLTLPISACCAVKVVQEYERAVIFRLGRLLPGGAKGPGIFFIVPCIDTYRKVDLRVLSFEVPPQEILSKDSVTVAVDAVVYFRISNATISVTNVEDASRSTKLLAQTTLRNILGTKTLAEMLSDREAISLQMQATLDEATEPWGVKVERVEVKDVRLPVQLQRAMAAEAEAAREARAKVIVAEGEQKASRALKEAADVIAESPQAIQLRYLQTLNSISAEKNSTIIFPFPIDLLSSLLHPQQNATNRSTQQQQSVITAPPPQLSRPTLQPSASQQQLSFSSSLGMVNVGGTDERTTVQNTNRNELKRLPKISSGGSFSASHSPSEAPIGQKPHLL